MYSVGWERSVSVLKTILHRYSSHSSLQSRVNMIHDYCLTASPALCPPPPFLALQTAVVSA